MAALTKVGISPTEPLSKVATKLTFEVDVFGPVSFATLDSALKRSCRTLATDQIFWLELLGLLLSANAVFFATKVRIFTFKTLVVGKFVHSELL